jgi:hypothetical protein
MQQLLAETGGKMKMLEITGFFLFMFLLIPLLSVFADDSKEQAATKAAESWLQLVDAGKYEESWEHAATLFKNAITKDEWVKTIKAAREPFGSFVSRTFKGAQYQTSLPGAPDGEYVIIQFDASFEKKKSAVETVTPMLEDGNWKVSGYYIR